MSDQTVKLIAPDDTSSASWNGQEFVVEDGAIAVPSEAVAMLLELGFSLPKAKKAKPTGKDAPKEPATTDDAPAPVDPVEPTPAA